MKKKTTEEFKKEIKILTNNEYILKSDYINNKTKVKILHTNCNETYEVTPHMFLNGNRCPICKYKKLSISNRKTKEDFKKEVFNLVGDEYEVIGDYVKDNVKIKLKHNKCKTIYSVTPSHFLQGNRCPKCFGSQKKTLEDFKKEVFNLVGDEYEVIDNKYINNKTDIKIKHNLCGNEYFIKPNYFITGNRCPKCFGSQKKTLEDFKKEVFNLVGDEYEVIGDYINSKTKIKLKHNICNKEYEPTPTNFLSNKSRCPYCNRSKGEEIIENWLITNNFKYATQFKFEDCKNKLPLPFDFKVELNENKFILIEYDGEQHFKECFYSSTLVEQKNRDEIKNNYCKNKNILLIRISYKDFNNIEEILNKKLGGFKVNGSN